MNYCELYDKTEFRVLKYFLCLLALLYSLSILFRQLEIIKQQSTLSTLNYSTGMLMIEISYQFRL